MSYEERSRRASNAGPGGYDAPPLGAVEDLGLSASERELLVSALLAYSPAAGLFGRTHHEVDALVAKLKGWGLTPEDPVLRGGD